MSRLEKRLCVFAIIFFIVYMGAVVITLHSKVTKKEEPTRIESANSAPGEGHLMLAELILPMLILFTISVCFLIVKKKREKSRLLLNKTEKETKMIGKKSL